MPTVTFDLNHDPITDLALDSGLEQELNDAINSDDRERAGLITAAVNEAITDMTSEYGWDGDWSATDIVTAILDVADEVDVLDEAIARDVETYNDGGHLEITHQLREGHEHDHGTEQGTLLLLRDHETGRVVLDRPYRLPASADHETDGRTYWTAFQAADRYLEAWLRLHGIDPTATKTFGTGWAVTFPRASWR